MRQVVGMAPHTDPKADQLINSNMPAANPDRTATGGADALAKVDLAPILEPKIKEGRQNGSRG
jgi:hypothetical protein